MSKYDGSKKNIRLSNAAIIIAIIAICAIVLFSSSIIRTVLITITAVAILLFIWRRMDKPKK